MYVTPLCLHASAYKTSTRTRGAGGAGGQARARAPGGAGGGGGGEEEGDENGVIEVSVVGLSRVMAPFQLVHLLDIDVQGTKKTQDVCHVSCVVRHRKRMW